MQIDIGSRQIDGSQVEGKVETQLRSPALEY